ncbi:MAG: Uncharacterised protein [Owenweeksia sp. TMED14]|nr:MAG: Uncharacterised protein [Owenweeksia sp. TMED14]
MSQNNAEPELPKTSIITLLESNGIRAGTDDASGGEWINNLPEQVILKENDSIIVKQAMVDTTLANTELIEVKDTERDITISHGMYLTDSGDGTLPGGNAQAAADIKFSKPPSSSPDGQNYILQNQVKDDHLTRIHFAPDVQTGNLVLPGVRPGATNPGLTASTPSFNMTFLPASNPDTDWFEYTIQSNGGSYVAPTGPFPAPFPNGSTSPIPAAGNFEGMNAILVTRSTDGVHEFRMYANGWNPPLVDPGVPGVYQAPGVNDHIGQIEIVQDVNGNHQGYQSTWNPTVNDLGIAASGYWVFRYGSSDAGGPPTAPTGLPGYGNFLYFQNYDASGGTYPVSTIYRICTGIYLMVQQKPRAPLVTYDFSMIHKEYDDDKTVTKVVSFNDWTIKQHVNEKSLLPVFNGLFAQQNSKYIVPNGGQDNQLPNANEALGTREGLVPTWVNFSQFPDPRQASRIVFEPFAYDFVYGIRLPTGLSVESGQGGIFNWVNAAKGQSREAGGKLLPKQVQNKAFPPIGNISCRLTPRIFETKIRIPADKYTYEALAQTITDELNKVPRRIPSFSNNPDVPSQALNARGWGPSRLLTSSYELSMQQSVGNDTGVGVRLPQFPSEYVWDNTAGVTALRPPVWLSEDSLTVCQYGQLITPTSNVRFCGAEAVSFIFDDTTQSFQIAQMHSNMYSRLNGGIITRQFIAVDEATSTEELINTDKNGGIFITGLQPESLFFDKMKFTKASLLITQLANNPAVRDFTDLGTEIPVNDQNDKLANALVHTCPLIPGRTITGNYIGASTLIDKRVRVLPAGGGDADPTGGAYALVNTAYNLETNTDTPITIRGEGIEAATDDDPFFQLEISGLNNQNIFGATKKNNLIQSIVGKYFTSGNFTTGNSDDSIMYIHKGDPIVLKSMKTRVLNSDGTVATGLGDKSAVILEITSTK